MLCAPAVIAMLLVTGYPIGYAVYLSLQKFDLRFPDDKEFVGLSNYVDVLTLEHLVDATSATRCSSPSSRWRSSWCSAWLIALVMHRAIFGRGAGARLDPDPVRHRHRGRRVRVALRVRPDQRLRRRACR